MMQLKKSLVEKWYKHLKTKLNPILFKAIIDYLTSGKVVVGILEGENAVSRVRQICGPTNPAESPKGTIRGDYGEDDLRICGPNNRPTRNIVHSSGSPEEAIREIKLLGM